MGNVCRFIAMFPIHMMLQSIYSKLSSPHYPSPKGDLNTDVPSHIIETRY